MVRTYVLTKHEKDILTKAVKNGTKLDGYTILVHRLRKTHKSLAKEFELIQQSLEA
jgi:hypothetical protein